MRVRFNLLLLVFVLGNVLTFYADSMESVSPRSHPHALSGETELKSEVSPSAVVSDDISYLAPFIGVINDGEISCTAVIVRWPQLVVPTTHSAGIASGRGSGASASAAGAGAVPAVSPGVAPPHSQAADYLLTAHHCLSKMKGHSIYYKAANSGYSVCAYLPAAVPAAAWWHHVVMNTHAGERVATMATLGRDAIVAINLTSLSSVRGGVVACPQELPVGRRGGEYVVLSALEPPIFNSPIALNTQGLELANPTHNFSTAKTYKFWGDTTGEHPIEAMPLHERYVMHASEAEKLYPGRTTDPVIVLRREQYVGQKLNLLLTSATHSTSSGDSGGPLLWFNAADRRWTLMGVLMGARHKSSFHKAWYGFLGFFGAKGGRNEFILVRAPAASIDNPFQREDPTDYQP